MKYAKKHVARYITAGKFEPKGTKVMHFAFLDGDKDGDLDWYWKAIPGVLAKQKLRIYRSVIDYNVDNFTSLKKGKRIVHSLTIYAVPN